MAEVNVPLLRKAVEWVEEQDKKPEIESEWYQGEWMVSDRQYAWRMASEGVAEYRDAMYARNEYLSYDEQKKLVELASYWLENSCGTAYCVAGYVAQMHEPGFQTAHQVRGESIENYARKKLGLSQDQADQLFSGGNDAADVRMIAEFIAGEKL